MFSKTGQTYLTGDLILTIQRLISSHKGEPTLMLWNVVNGFLNLKQLRNYKFYLHQYKKNFLLSNNWAYEPPEVPEIRYLSIFLHRL